METQVQTLVKKTIEKSSYTTPEGVVQFRNIQVNIQTNDFTLDLGFKAKGKKSFVYETVNGKITYELKRYLTLLSPIKEKVPAHNERGYDFIETNKMATNFQKYLMKRNIEYKPNILQEMIFESENSSDEYYPFPFKLVQYSSGHCTLTLINIASKKQEQFCDPVTGEIKTIHTQRTFIKDGKVNNFYLTPASYRRYVKQVVEKVEIEVLQ